MSPKKHHSQQKLFVIRTYSSLSQIATVISTIVEKDTIQLQLSVLGKLTIQKTMTKKELKKIIADVKKQLSTILGKEFKFGYFHNPEVGSLFIAGHLMPTFLTKVDESELASLPAGLRGIFKGLGIHIEEINTYLTELKNENYCLIIRGEKSVLAVIEPLLNSY